MNLLSTLNNHPLFKNISEKEILQLMSCFHFQERHFSKDEYLVLEGDSIQLIGIILQGTVYMEKNDLYGNHYFVTEFKESEIFGDTFISHNILSSSVNYKATTNCTVLFFSYPDIWHHCPKHCMCHTVFTENLMSLLAIKTRTLLTKIEILSQRTLREKILSFLMIMQSQQNTIDLQQTSLSIKSQVENKILISFNHTELANYLCVNRSSLVRELSKMKKDGILSYDKNMYTLYLTPHI